MRRVAAAQAFPARPVHLIVGYPAGSTADIIARLAGNWLSERLGQPFIIENRPGAGTGIATEAVVRAAPDGYTLLQVSSTQAINATLFKNSYDFIRDIAPVASIMRAPGVMEVNPAMPARTVPEFIAYARANPGKITMASAGNGSNPHLYGALFMQATGIDMVHVPYRGSVSALTDLMGGQVQVMFDNVPTSLEYIRSGKLRALAVTAATQIEALPEVPPLGTFVPGYEASLWQGIGAPKSTSPEIIDRLNRQINAALADPKMKARLAQLGGTALGGSPAEFGKLVAEDTEKWAKVIRLAGIKAE
jgi:tripartite-type tricarboxylate transporter receptor subunit TctC